MVATQYTPPALKKPWWDVGGLGGQATQRPVPPLGATAQDTGAGWLAGQPGMFGNPNASPGDPDWGGSVMYAPGYGPNGQKPSGQAAAGGSAFGTTYADPGGGWNPWSLYDGRQGYDGTAVDGHYNAAADTAKGWGPNGTPETDRDRVWRMTLDTAKAQGWDAGAPQNADRLKTAFLANVARLKRDYENTPGMTWAGSAFSGYDKFAQGGTGQAQPTAASSSSAPNGQGGNPMNPLPPYGQGAATGTTAAGVTTQPGGSMPSVPPVAPPGGTPGTGTPGAPTGAYYKSDPSVAVTQFLQQHGVNVGDHGPFADFLRKLATGVATPAMSILANNPNGQMSGDQLNNLPGMLSNLIYGNGGQVFGNLRDFANTSMGQFGATQFKGMDAGAVQSLLQTINALKTMGDNPYMQNFTQNALQDLFTKYKLADFTSMTPPGGAVGTSQNADWFLNPQNDPYGLFR